MLGQSRRDQEGFPRELLERLHRVELYTSRVVRDALLGDYRSNVRGHGFDFDQHKKYQYGDDFRQIDWNVLARTEEVYVKRNFEDKELNMVVVTDVSRSMELATRTMSKKEMLMEITATLVFSAAADNIGAGLLAFAGQVEDYLPPAKGRQQMWKILERLWGLRPKTSETDLIAPLEFLNHRLKKSSLIFYVSDLAGKAELIDSPHLKVMAKRHDLVPIVIQDKLESSFPQAKGFLRVKDVESRRDVLVRISHQSRLQYNQSVEARKAELRAFFYRTGLDHLWLQSDQPYINPILEFFLSRKRRR